MDEYPLQRGGFGLFTNGLTVVTNCIETNVKFQQFVWTFTQAQSRGNGLR